jgi:tetratricopeptide (TPR) repeat protein
MAEKDASKPAAAAEPPKPVQLGGESLVDRLRPHIKQILVGAVVLAVVISAIFLVGWFRERKHIASTEQLNRVIELAQQPVRGKDEKLDPKHPSFANAKERAEQLLAALAKENTTADGPAFRGGLLLDAGKLDEAIAEYRKGATDKTLLGVLSREGLGVALEAKASAEKDPAARQKGYEEALAAFAAMQPEPTGPRYGFALYHQGRLQALLGKRAEAKALFEKAEAANKADNKVSDSELAELLEKRLATLGET